MLGTRWPHKPPVGYNLDPDHPLAQGLASFLAFNESSGLPFDLAAGAQALSNSGTRVPSPYGTALKLAAGSQRVAMAPLVSQIGAGPFTLAWQGSAATNYAGELLCSFGITTQVGPGYSGVAIGTSPNNWDVRIQSSTAQYPSSYASPVGSLDGNIHTTGVSVGVGAGDHYIQWYQDGLVLGAAESLASLPGLLTATTNYIGGPPAYGPPPATLNWFGLWGRGLTAADHAALAVNPWQMIRPRRTSTFAILGSPTFGIVPSPIAASSAGFTVTLTGNYVNWVSGTTTFTLSGISDAAIVSATINSTTSATLVISTGATTGSLTITDNNGYHASVPVVVATIASSPAAIPGDHAGHITLNLTGTATDWTPGSTSTFSISGVTGVTPVSQSVATATTATLVVTTGSGVGTLTISDGVAVGTVAVTAPALSCVPTGLPATGTSTINLVGLNTIWTQETISPLFTISGIVGANLSDIAVSTNATATALLSLGTSQTSGTILVTDASTGATTSVAIAAVPSGSLHVTGPLMLEHTGGSVGLFGTQTAAGIAWSFQANSNTGRNLAAGTTVIGWGTEDNNVPLAVYYPATQTLAISVYGSSGPEFSTTVPIQLGVGYRFLLAWSVVTNATSFTGTVTNGSPYITGITSTSGLLVGDMLNGTGISTGVTITAILGGSVVQMSSNATATAAAESIGITRGLQTLYLDGLPYATATIPYATYAYRQVQIGGNAGLSLSGATVATDHQVSDLAIWSGATPTANDALGLANRSLTPLDTSAPASAWWSLGGGTVGGSPALSDPWFTDRTQNGNALTVLTGTLGTSAAYAAPVTNESPALVAGQIWKCGKIACFSATAAGLVNGAHPITSVVAVNGAPTLDRNGTTVQLGSPIWFSVNQSSPYDGPFVSYPLECGAVQMIAIGSGGAGYTSPTASASGGGGTGLVLGTPVTQTGLAGYTIIEGGAGFSDSPTVAIVDLGGSGVGATAVAVVNRTLSNVAQVNLTAGGSGYVDPQVYIAAGYGETLAPGISGGALNSIGVTAGGSNYPSGTLRVAISDPTGSGAVYVATCAGGAITGFTKLSPGSGYTNPTIVVYNPAFSYSQPTATATQTGGVVTATVMTNNGSGYGIPPQITISPPPGTAGQTGNITATPHCIVRGGAIVSVFPKVGGLLGCGSGYSTSAQITISIGGGTGAVLTANLGSGGAISTVTVTAGGIGYSSSTPITIWDSAGTGAALTCTVSGGASVATVTVASGGTGYVAPVFTIGASGVSLKPIISPYIASVPVTSPGENYTSPPTITIADPTGSGAILQPLMTGVLASDVLTYSAPASWFTPQVGGHPLGGVQAVSGAAVANWTGQREGTTGGLGAFAATPVLLAGASAGTQPSYSQNEIAYFKNRRFAGIDWTGYGPPTITFAADGVTPVSWVNNATYNTSGTIFVSVNYAVGLPNELDTMGRPGHPGQWTFQYNDPNVNTTTATTAWLTTGVASQGVTVTPVPAAGMPAPVTMNPNDVVFSNSVVTGLTTTSTTFGTGWQAALVLFNGGLLSNTAAAIAICSGGNIQEFVMCCGGAYFSGKPTVVVYPLALSGTQVTGVFDFAYTSSATAWELDVLVMMAQPQNTFNITNIWAVAPDTSRGNLAVASIDTTKPLAVDDAVVAALTAPNGRAPGALRYMDATAGYGGESNYIDASDIMSPTWMFWDHTIKTVVAFQYIRCVNTNPANTSYTLIDGVTPYSSPKVYGFQSMFVGGVDDTFTNYGGQTVSGTPYLALSPNDNGIFLAPGSGNAVVYELRSLTPHGLKSGQQCMINITSYLTVTDLVGGSGYTSAPTVTITGGAGTYASATATVTGGAVTAVDIVGSCGYASTDTPTITFSGGGGGTGAAATLVPANSWFLTTSDGYTLNNSSLAGATPMVMVTGPYTVCAYIFVGGPSNGNPQAIVSNIEVPISIQVTRKVPSGISCIPYEFAATMANQVGTDLWLNLPPMATDGCIEAIAAKVIANIGPTAIVRLEYGNENWNYGFSTYQWQTMQSVLLGYVPNGTQALTYFTGGTPWTGYAPSLLAAHAFTVFGAAWTAAGLPTSRLKRIYGSWWSGNGNFTAGVLNTIQRIGGPPVDHVCIATYMYTSTAPPTLAAVAPAGSWGSTSGGAASLSIDAINDLCRFWMAYSNSNWSLWSGHGLAVQTYGQPLSSLGFTTTNATAMAVLTPTSIASIAVSSVGSYTVVPTVELSGGGGTYTSAVATMTGTSIAGVAMTANGSGYTSVPTVTFSGGGTTTQASATATIANGIVTGITIVSGGSGYTSMPTIAFSGGGGSGAAATAVLTATGVASVAVTGSSGYTTAPTVLFVGNTKTLAAATAILTPTSVASINVTNGGAGYNSSYVPTVAFSSGGGTGATARSVTIASGAITAIAMGASGSGYTSPPYVSIAGGGTGELVAGSYYASYTFVDAEGRETTTGLSLSLSLSLNATALPVILMPAWPLWAQQLNIYLSAPNGAAGTGYLYLSIPRSQYGPGNLYPIGAQIPLTTALATTAVSPPTTNLAAANIGQPLPQLVCYEGGVSSTIPNGTPFANYLLHDSFAHPSYRDAVWGWYATCQQGSTIQPGSGAVLAMYFSMYSLTTYPNMWVMSYGSMQPPGAGTSNQFATPQGGLPADAHDHNGGPNPNVSTAMQGWQDWYSATTPTPTPTPTVARKWFSGLRKPVMRLGS